MNRNHSLSRKLLTQHLIEYVASSREDLFRQMDGKTFKRFNGEVATLNLTGQTVISFQYDGEGTSARRT